MKPGNKPTVEPLLTCCEARTKLAAKLGVSLLGFLEKARLGSMSASLDRGVQITGLSIRDGKSSTYLRLIF